MEIMGRKKLEGLSRKPSVYEYLNYREFLYQYYDYKKSIQKGFSFSVLARIAGIRTTNLLIMIVNNKRNLTEANIPGLARACGLNERETQYFELLVRWNQENEAERKRELELKLQKAIPRKSFKELVDDHLSLIRNWYSLALLEMVNMHGFQFQPKWIVKHAAFRLTEEDVIQTFQNFLRLGLVTRKGEAIEKAFETTFFKTETPSEIVRDFHEKNALFAARRVKEVPMENRQYVSTTLALTKKDFATLKALISDFQQTLLDYAQGIPKGENVYQCNIQFFPMTEEKTSS